MFVISVSGLVLAAGGAPASAAPAEVSLVDIVGGTLECGSRTYTVTGGVLQSVFRSGASPSGNRSETSTLVAKGVTLTLDGAVYGFVGAQHAGQTSHGEDARGVFTSHFNIIDTDGRVVDRVSQTARFSEEGVVFLVNKGTCSV